MNIDKIKKEFPIFNDKVQNHDLVYLDSANSSQKPLVVVDRIYDFYTKEFSNVGRSVHYLAVAATNLYENTRTSVQKYINAKDKDEIVFTKGATEAINLVASTFGQKYLKEGDEVLVTELEHHSNYVPWHYLRKSKGVKIEFAEVDEDGDISIDEIKRKITDKTKIIAITHLSNVTGAILPIKEIVDLAHKNKSKVLIDGAQGAAHFKINLQELDVDYYVASAHKLCGPTGVGFLYGKSELLNSLPPYQGGGEMISTVTFNKTEYADLPHKFEAGTPNIAGVIGFGAAIDYMNEIGFDNIESYEQELLKYATDKLNKIPGLKIYGNPSKKISVISFNLSNHHPSDIGSILDQFGIAVRTGQHCTQPVMDYYNIPGTVRVSLSFYNTKSEIDLFIDALKKASSMLG